MDVNDVTANILLSTVVLLQVAMSFLHEIENHWSSRVDAYSENVERQLSNGLAEKWISEVMKDIPEGKVLKVLDVGCGPGFFEMALGSRGHDVTGVDYNSDMVEKAKGNCRSCGVDATFYKMDAQNLDFDDESFDLVVSRDVLWNLDDPAKAYSEMHRVLKSGGKLTVFDGNYYLYAHDKAYESMNVDKCMEIYHNDDPSCKDRINYMAGIATQLPSSKYRRPQWDLGILIELGMDRVTAKMNRENEVRFEDDGRIRTLPFTFSLYVQSNDKTLNNSDGQ